MTDKFSVYNNSMGGGMPAAPIKPPPAALPFTRDKFVGKAVTMDDATRIELHQKQHENLVKYFKMLLSSIFPSWKSEANVPKPPREPIQRKEKVPVRREKVDFELVKIVEETSDKIIISIGKGLAPVFIPPYKLALFGLDLLGKGLVKVEQGIDKLLIKTIVEPLIIIRDKVLPPLERVATYIVEKIVILFESIERECERIIEWVIAPLAEALETVQTTFTKLVVPFRKAKNWLAKKMPSIPKPSFSAEPFDRLFIKPLKTFINTFIATPLAKGIQKAAKPIKQCSQYVSQKGKVAYAIVSNFYRGVSAKIGKYLEAILRKIGRFFRWLFKKIWAFIKAIGRFIRRIPSYISLLILNIYDALCRLTHWAANLFNNR